MYENTTIERNISGTNALRNVSPVFGSPLVKVYIFLHPAKDPPGRIRTPHRPRHNKSDCRARTRCVGGAYERFLKSRLSKSSTISSEKKLSSSLLNVETTDSSP